MRRLRFKLFSANVDYFRFALPKSFQRTNLEAFGVRSIEQIERRLVEDRWDLWVENKAISFKFTEWSFIAACVDDKSEDHLGIADVGGVFLLLTAGCLVAFVVGALEFLSNVEKIAIAEKVEDLIDSEFGKFPSNCFPFRWLQWKSSNQNYLLP